jgi:hypothetical protein
MIERLPKPICSPCSRDRVDAAKAASCRAAPSRRDNLSEAADGPCPQCAGLIDPRALVTAGLFGSGGGLAASDRFNKGAA